MYDIISKIEKIDVGLSIDIEVSGDHYFFANDILTHNSNSDPGLEDTSESFGLPATADLMVALVSSEEMEQQGQIMVKQLKNRYNDVNHPKRFVIGVDRTKMRLYDIDNPLEDITDDTPTFDKSKSQEKFNKFKME